MKLFIIEIVLLLTFTKLNLGKIRNLFVNNLERSIVQKRNEPKDAV